MAILMEEGEVRQNLGVLIKFLAFLAAVMVLFSVLFHVIMIRVEGQEHSWFTGFYWTLVTMSTLGFGDVTFQTDLGRVFSVVVLFSGVILLLVVLPFIFIRYFYAPWFEAQVRYRAPRQLKTTISDHVIVSDYDLLGPGLVAQFRAHEIPYVFLCPDAERAASLSRDGIEVVYGDLDAIDTYYKIHANSARLLVANQDDRTNTNVILTAREVAPELPILAIANSEDAIDILQLAGADSVVPLRRQLGEQLANRINAGHAQTHVIGSFGDLLIAEFPILNTPLVGKTVRQTRLRESLGLNLIGLWEGGRFKPTSPEHELTDHCILVVVGSRERLDELDELLYIYDTNWNPVIVIGGGKVGRSATRALQRKGVTVHLVERNAELARKWEELPDRMVVGDAAHRELLLDAGIEEAPSVLLTTNDDATNVFLAVYCRKLNPDTRIVSRVTHERNVDSIRRAGADLVLSYASLAVQTITARARSRPLVLLGEGVELIEEDVPPSLAGKTLAESEIGESTGLTVVAVRDGESMRTTHRADQRLPEGGRLFLIGSPEGLEKFHDRFVNHEDD
ncbi:MAG: potassium transporter TrkA [Gemmatimonadales bacterium]|nr:MAG: potassium transporter TrkA [Gemmatimonadales bacterium]